MRALILAVTGFVVSVAACSSYGTSVVEVNKTQARVAYVSVTLPSSLTAGQKTRGVAITKDSDGAVLTGRSVSWFTSSGAVASVTDSGMISAVAPGTAVVSAVSEGVSGQATMAVLPPPPTPVATVAVAVTPSAVVVGQTATATATLADSSGNLLSGRVVTWSSSNTTVATVDTGGTVIAKAAGSAMIQATSESKASASSLSVSAPAPIPVASVSVSPTTASLLFGGSTQLSAVTHDANGNVLTGRVIAWGSANTGIATVSTSGLVTAVAAGNVSVTASSEGQVGSSAITVTAPAPVPVATVSVSPSSSSLLVGATVQLSATTRDANNNVLTGRVVTWSSPNSGIASVGVNGLVTAIGAGTIQITATSEGVNGSASVTVTVPPPPPPPGSSNEPTGMTLIDERPFNSLGEHAAPYSPAWDTDASLSIATDATAPKSPSNVLRTTFPAGYAGGTAPGHAGVGFTGHRVLYISYWANYSTNWWGHLTGVNKHGYAWANGSPIFVMEAEAVGSGPMTLRMAIQGSPSSDKWYTPNLVPGVTITRGVWFHLEYVVVGNTAGNSDGTMDFWLDGVHVGSFSGLQYTSGATSWDTFEWRPIWGGVSDVVPATQTLDVDHIYLSAKN
jgi:uncharacterized protein YjdB